MKNGIYVVATPIGNLGDISARALEVLTAADVVACEDTRVTKKLFSLLGLSLKKTFISFQDHNEEEQAQNLINMVNDGKIVAQVSDAGSPLISDPGYKLIKHCRQQGIYICTIPGACALICALQLSGLPTNSFMFAGFIPNKEKARADLFKSLKDINTTLIFYETAPRIVKTLNQAQEIFGEREMAVAREITKVYEECLTGTATQLLAQFTAKEPRGEMVFMVAPPFKQTNADVDVEGLLKIELANSSVKTAVKKLVEEYSLNKNEVYELALKVKNGN